MLTRLAALMTRFPPHPNDYPILWRMRKLGIEVGKPFDAAKLDPATRRADRRRGEGRAGVAADSTARGLRDEGARLVDELRRHRRLRHFLPAARGGRDGQGSARTFPEDAVYPMSQTDVAGEPYVGENRYRLRFEKDELPPVDAFWSITLYDDGRLPGAERPEPFRARRPRRAPVRRRRLARDLHRARLAGRGQGVELAARAPKAASTSRCGSTRRATRCSTASGSPPGVVKMTRGHPKRNR